MTRQTGALIGLSAVASFLLGLVAAGTRPPESGKSPQIGEDLTIYLPPQRCHLFDANGAAVKRLHTAAVN
jgi:hypothetical protein